jgi:TolA-binding protein
MLNKTSLLILTAVLMTGAAACKKAPPPPKPGELTTEQRAALRKKAIDTYEKIVTKYPDSEYAPKAQERLNALRAQQPK